MRVQQRGWPAAVRQELIRDKFVFGLTDDSLKEKLLREASLTLNQATEIAQRTESSKRHIKDMTKFSNRANVDAMTERSYSCSKPTYCGQCGQIHKPKECPAYGQKCLICHKLHHFAKVCRNKTALPRHKKSQKTSFRSDHDSRTGTKSRRKLHEVQENDHTAQSNPTSDNESDSFQSSDEFDLSPLQIEGIKKSSAWLTDISANGNRDTLTMKLDTGAEVSVLPMHLYNKLQVKPPLKTTSMKLSAYGGTSIKPMGICKLPCTGNGKVCDVKFYVAPVNAQAILGLNDCVQLGLVKRVCDLQTELSTKDTIRDNYSSCFSGLGNLGRYHITMVANRTPVVNPPRRVPHSLKQRLHHALDQNVKSRVLVA